jgi:hypothetical protein
VSEREIGDGPRRARFEGPCEEVGGLKDFKKTNDTISLMLCVLDSNLSVECGPEKLVELEADSWLGSKCRTDLGKS